MSKPKIFVDSNKAAAELCKRKLSFFVREFWDVIIAEELKWNWHMDVLCDEVQLVYERAIQRKEKLYDLIINIPPGSSKSTIVTVMAPAWAWTKDASLRMITGSYSDSLATEHSVKSRDIVESDRYQKYFPDVEIKYDKGRKTNYETTSLGQRYATSVGGAVTGIHAHVITIDDPLNPKQATSQVEIKSANDWMDKTLSQRKIDKKVTPTILIMQRLATNDPTGYILQKKKANMRHICLPAELSNNVKPAELKKFYKDGLLDPERISQAVVEEARIDLGNDGYSGQMAQEPVQEGGLTWKKFFIEIEDHLFPDMQHATSLGSDWDLAYTDEEKNAASAYVTAGKIGKNAYIFDLDFAFLEFPELIKYMKSKRGPHYIEAKASGKSAKQTLVRMGIPAIEIKVAGSADKVARAKMASPFAEAGLVYVKKSLADKLYNHFQQGILSFPRGSHKDLADALAQSILRLFKGQLVSSSAGESFLDYAKW